MRRNADYQFIPTEPEEIIAWLTAKYQEITRTTVRPASPENLFIMWTAAAFVHERALANYAANQNIPSRAEGLNLDALAELFHIRERPGARAASCTMRFHISQAQNFAIPVPKGTRVTDANQVFVWETVEDTYVKPGETYVDVKVTCLTVGAEGNGYVVGQIDSIVDPFAYFISCSNITESDGGGDAATDEEYYELMRLSQDAYSCAGARGGYIYFAKQVDTTIADVVAASPTPGVVKLYVLMDDGEIAGEEIKERVLAACSADDVRPLTDFVSVEDPEIVEYNINLRYYNQSNAGISAVDLEKAVQEKVGEYTTWQSARLGRDINPSRLISMLMETGVKRVELTEPAFLKLKDGTGPGEVPQIAKVVGVTIADGGYEDE